MLREKLRNRKGFTLIEIIVVIVILAVLMAVAVPSVMSYMNEGNKAKYETVARAALINTQTAVAKDYGEDGKINKPKDVAAWVDGTASNDVNEYYGSAKSYNGATVLTTQIVLNNTNTDKADDVESATFDIKIGSDVKEVKVVVNGKMTVKDVDSSTAATAKAAETYTPKTNA